SPLVRNSHPPTLAIPRMFVEIVTTRDVKHSLAAASDLLAGSGARIEDVALPASADQIGEVGRVVLRAEAAAFHQTWFSAHSSEYAPKIRELVEAGLRVGGVEFVLADRARRQFREDLAPIFERYDALLMPAAPATAPPLSMGTTGDPVLCAPWSFGGFPAIAIPSGLSAEGLPFGIQLVAGAHKEQRLLEVAKWCEGLLKFTAQPKL
ncbi:MAG: amidase family protein, partial [Acidimicrobiia bacterium]